jgi:hypothetical protein
VLRRSGNVHSKAENANKIYWEHLHRRDKLKTKHVLERGDESDVKGVNI